MKATDQFIEWLREKILQNPQEPPAESWQEISDALDLEESWEKIGEELELNTIWNKIDARLDTYGSFLKYERLGYAFASAIAVIFLTGVFLLDPVAFEALSLTEDSPVKEKSMAIKEVEEGLGTDKNIGKSGREENLKSEEAVGTIAAVPDSGKKSNPQTKFPLYEEGAQGVQAVQAKTILRKDRETDKIAVLKKNDATMDIALTQEKEIMQHRTDARELLPYIQSQKYLLADLHYEFTVIQPIGRLLEPKVEEELEEKQGENPYPSAYVGAGSAVKVSWLLNNKTLYAMEKNSLLTAVPSYHTDWYMLYGSRINNKVLLQADLYVKDVVGQDYKEYRNGQYGQVKDKLYYQSLGLSLSRLGKQISYGKYPTFVRLTGGIYGGRLQKAEEITFAGSVDKTNEYAKFHLGALGGYEYDTFLGENFILSYGLRGRLDLLNIYSGTDHVPAAFRRTRAFSVDFTFSLKYVLKK